MCVTSIIQKYNIIYLEKGLKDISIYYMWEKSSFVSSYTQKFIDMLLVSNRKIFCYKYII